MADEFDLVKISELPAATTPGEYDVLAGVQTGDTKQFSFAVLLSWMQQAITATAIGAVPQTRKINNHALTSDITLTASDVGAIPTSEKGANGGVAELDNSGKVPTSQLPPIASSAADVTYDNTTSGLQADDVQEAIDELAAGAGGSTASTTTYDNTDSGLSATNVQDAIDEIVDEKADQSTVAPRETSTTAAQAHGLGTIFYLNGVLYRALSDIAIGDTINTASGGNATQTTIAQNFKRTVTLTSAQYSQLSAAEKAADIVYIVTDDNTIAAADVSYDNSASGLTASTTQAAVDELADGKANQSQLAYVESGTTASRAYAEGEYFCRDGQTCRAKTAIAQGATLTLDTNYEVPAGGGLNSIVKRNTSALTGTATGTATNVIYYNDFLVQIHFVSAGITWVKGDSLGTIPAELRPPMEVKAVAGTPSGTSVQLSINPSNGGIFAQNDNNVTARLSFNVIYMR